MARELDRGAYSPHVERSTGQEQTNVRGLTALVLCGGKGTRLREVTGNELPKPLVEIGGKRLIDHSVFPLKQAGVKDFIYAVGYRSDMVRDHVSTQEYADSARFSREHTGGASSAIRAALSEFDVTGHTAILAADTVIKGLDVADAYNFHLAKKANLTLIANLASRSESNSDDTLINEKDSTRTALIIPNTEDHLEDPIIFSGMAICSPDATDFIKNSTGELPLLWDNLIVHMSMIGEVHTYMAPEPLVQMNVNHPEDLEKIGSEL